MSEKLKGITQEEFETLLQGIGYDILRKELIKLAPNLPRTSVYYLGKVQGRFWDGYRKERIPNNKVHKFYYDEVFLNKTKLDLEDVFIDIVKNKFNINSNDLIESINANDNGYYIPLCKLFEVDMTNEKLMFISELEKIKKEYEERLADSSLKINELISENKKLEEEKLDNLREISKLKENISSQVKKYNEFQDSLEKAAVTKINEMLSKNIDEKKMACLINGLSIEKESELIEYVSSLSSEIKEYLLNNKIEDAIYAVISQYILIKIRKR